MLLCLRPQGASSAEIKEVYGGWSKWGAAYAQILNCYGYEIRKIGGKHSSPYVLTGKIMGFNKFRELRHPLILEQMVMKEAERAEKARKSVTLLDTQIEAFGNAKALLEAEIGCNLTAGQVVELLCRRYEKEQTT